MHRFIPSILFTLILFSANLANQLYHVDSYKKDTSIKKIEIHEIKAGTLVKKIKGTNQYEILPKMKTNVNVNIDGMVGDTKMEQLFVNNSSEPIEATYVFPLNHNAAVNNMYFIVNDRIIESKIKEKSQAQKEYKEAKKEGKRAAIVNQERPNIFTQSIANIMPNDSIKVIINYVQSLKYENQEFTYRLPLAITPRYSKTSNVNTSYETDPISSVINDSEKINPNYLDESIDYANNIEINVNLNSGFKIKDIKSSHKIITKKNNDTTAEIKLKNNKIQADQDFTLSYSITNIDKPQISVFSTEKFNEDYYMIMAMGPNNLNNNQHIPKEVTFVIDKSGSMNGHNIEYAKISVIQALNTLNNNDSFNVIAFSDDFIKYNFKPVLANEENIYSATKFVNNINSGGGTQALPALDWAMQEEHETNKIKMIIFLTDGAVGYESDVFQLIDESNINDARIFPICIGYAPNSFLLQKIAEMTRGSYTYIKNHGEITKQLTNLFNKIENPVLSNISINFDQNSDYYPNPIKDLYFNEPLIIFCKANSSFNEITFKGETSTGKFNKKFNLNDIKINKHSAIPALWARQKIASLMDNYRLSRATDKKQQIKNKIIDISENYNILSKFTSFIGVESKIVNKEGYLLSTEVGSQLPKNWKKNNRKSYEQKNNNYAYMPQTASNNPTYLIFGIILLFVALFINRYNEKYFQI